MFEFITVIACYKLQTLTRYSVISSQFRAEYRIAAKIEREVMASHGMRNCCLLFTPPSITMMLANRSMATLKRTRIRFRLMVVRLDK